MVSSSLTMAASSGSSGVLEDAPDFQIGELDQGIADLGIGDWFDTDVGAEEEEVATLGTGLVSSFQGRVILSSPP